GAAVALRAAAGVGAHTLAVALLLTAVPARRIGLAHALEFPAPEARSALLVARLTATLEATRAASPRGVRATARGRAHAALVRIVPELRPEFPRMLLLLEAVAALVS